MKTMPFGKHKGQPLAEVPTTYLRWLAGLDDLREPLRSAVHAELDRREDDYEPTFTTTRPCPAPGLAEELVGAGLRSLARRHHPDAGGSDDVMQRVNAAAEWLRSVIGPERAA